MGHVLMYLGAYALFSGLSKLAGGIAGALTVLPITLTGAALFWALILAWMVRIRRWQPAPLDRIVLLAGLASLLILLPSVAIYTLPGPSIIVPILLMKGGSMHGARLIDALRGRKVNTQGHLVLLLGSAGVLIGVLPRLGDGTLSWGALGLAGAYVLGYCLKLWALDGRKGQHGFLLTEMSITTLGAVPISWALLSLSPDAIRLPLVSESPWPWLAGLASQGCGYFGGLLLLRRNAHTICVALSRCASVIAGLLASYVLGLQVSGWELSGATILLGALVIGSLQPQPDVVPQALHTSQAPAR